MVPMPTSLEHMPAKLHYNLHLHQNLNKDNKLPLARHLEESARTLESANQSGRQAGRQIHPAGSSWCNPPSSTGEKAAACTSCPWSSGKSIRAQTNWRRFDSWTAAVATGILSLSCLTHQISNLTKHKLSNPPHPPPHPPKKSGTQVPG